MYRTVGILIALLLASALGLVSSQNHARQLYAALERENERARQFEIEWNRLQIEAGTLGATARVDRIARERMRMRPPAPEQAHLVFGN